MQAEGGDSPPQRERLAFRLLLWTALVAVVAIAAEDQLLETFRITSHSMVPTLEVGDRVLAYSIPWLRPGVATGDLVTFFPPPAHESPIPLVKRVVALPGDVVSIAGGVLLVNGMVRSEPYTGGTPITYDFPAYRVPARSVFVLGDNRNSSEDSTVFGPIAYGELRHEVLLRYAPWERRCAFGRSWPGFPDCAARPEPLPSPGPASRP